MKYFAWLAALFAALMSVNALADCDHVKNNFDDLYCLNKVYIQTDKDLNDTYGKLAKLLDADGKGKLKTGQLAWMAARNEQCSYQDSRGFFVNMDCATNTTRERLQFLQERVRECQSAGCMKSKL